MGFVLGGHLQGRTPWLNAWPWKQIHVGNDLPTLRIRDWNRKFAARLPMGLEVLKGLLAIEARDLLHVTLPNS